jgi:hypothetical protein
MPFSTYGELKNELSATLFHQRSIARYDSFTQMFEASANSRLRVLPMEHMVLLTTVNGEVALPTDYITWRTVKPTTTPYIDELDYVHPTYLPATQHNRRPPLFTIEGNTFKVRPVDDRPDAYEFHYYRKIPSLLAPNVGGVNLNTNWLLQEYPNVYLFGLLTEAAANGRNLEMAQLEKARRDEALQEIIQRYALTTGATSPTVRTGTYF